MPWRLQVLDDHRPGGRASSATPGCRSSSAAIVTPSPLTTGTEAAYSPSAVSPWFSAYPRSRTSSRIVCSSATPLRRRPGRRDEEPPAEQRRDGRRRMRGEHHPAARRGEGRGLRPDVRDEPDRLRRLLEREEERLAAVEHREGDRLVVPREELGGDRAECLHDRQVGGARPEAERPDAEREPALGVPNGPAALDEHGQDPVQGALCERRARGRCRRARAAVARRGDRAPRASRGRLRTWLAARRLPASRTR